MIKIARAAVCWLSLGVGAIVILVHEWQSQFHGLQPQCQPAQSVAQCRRPDLWNDQGEVAEHQGQSEEQDVVLSQPSSCSCDWRFSTILLGGRLLSVSSQFIRLNKSEGDARLVSLQLQVCPAFFATKAAMMAGAPSFWMVKLARSTALFSGTPCSVNTCTSLLNWSVERVARAFAKVLPTSPGWLRIHLWMVCTSGWTISPGFSKWKRCTRAKVPQVLESTCGMAFPGWKSNSKSFESAFARIQVSWRISRKSPSNWRQVKVSPSWSPQSKVQCPAASKMQTMFSPLLRAPHLQTLWGFPRDLLSWKSLQPHFVFLAHTVLAKPSGSFGQLALGTGAESGEAVASICWESQISAFWSSRLRLSWFCWFTCVTSLCTVCWTSSNMPCILSSDESLSKKSSAAPPRRYGPILHSAIRVLTNLSCFSSTDHGGHSQAHPQNAFDMRNKAGFSSVEAEEVDLSDMALQPEWFPRDFA